MSVEKEPHEGQVYCRQCSLRWDTVEEGRAHQKETMGEPDRDGYRRSHAIRYPSKPSRTPGQTEAYSAIDSAIDDLIDKLSYLVNVGKVSKEDVRSQIKVFSPLKLEDMWADVESDWNEEDGE